MAASLRHRGPDDEGLESLPNASAVGAVVMLAHTRLAILDLSRAGHQPMQDPATGNWIVLNGEIYNYKELREEMRRAGDQRWLSDSDTEVLLRAYGRWGRECLGRLRGMFAFALWDQAHSRLILARDPLGIKPLYYSTSAQRLLFASELRALLASGLVSAQIGSEGVHSYLSFGSIEDPLTIVRDVQSLPPGHLLTAEIRGRQAVVSTERYETLPPSDARNVPAGRRASADAVRQALEQSVRAHLVSDVPVGAFLSGGIDSSAVVALARTLSGKPLRTFSVVFAERGFSEAEFARAIAQRYHTDHTEVSLSEGELLTMLPRALAGMDQPTIDGINTYVISQAVRAAGIKVALSGLGGDELFGGYPSFARVQRARWIRQLPAALRHTAAKSAAALLPAAPRAAKALDFLTHTSPRDVYVLSRRLFAPTTMRALCRQPLAAPPSARLPLIPPHADEFLTISLCELGHYMTNTLLRDTDCMSMAHALEVRVPFVDRAVVATALAIPSAHKTDPRRPKALLLDAVADLLPDEVWSRPKMGFRLPFERWMVGPLRADIERVMSDDSRFSAIGVRAVTAQNIWRAFQRRPRQVGWSRPWALYVLAKWCETNGATGSQNPEA